ncbi:hypothetical protein [Rheinheimera sp. UJ63]|uniref:hypothetical protein n=1 Tax=Rheinheimera sp. UJ63 TaxID=2910157 RepID=UPI001F441648|nr:hypothetical protein [Rheinheimera sp. UJ63]MCF4009305.1 hypothetical protein [Rheinheimera sp. UJ63]
MQKLTLAAVALLATFSGKALAQEEKVVSFGGVGVTTLVAGSIAASVIATIVSNARQSGALPGNETGPLPPELVLVCKTGDAAPVNGICTTNSTTVTVTGTGTNTTTITVPVTSTYLAILTNP